MKINKRIVGTGVAFTIGLLTGIILDKSLKNIDNLPDETSSDEEKSRTSVHDLPGEISLDEEEVNSLSDLPDEIVPDDDGVGNLPDEVSIKDLEGGKQNEEEKGNS